MSRPPLLRRLFGAPEQRTWTEPPPIPLNSERGSFTSRSVNLSTTEGAMQKVAVAASVNVLATIASTLPLKVYRDADGDRVQVPIPPWLADLGGEGYGTADWLFQLVYSWGLRGNAYGIPTSRDPQSGVPRTIALQHPDDVNVHREGGTGLPMWNVNGKPVDRDRIWHRRVYPIPGAIRGASPIARHATTIGLGLASEQFGAQFFLDGGHPTALLRNTQRAVTQAQAGIVKQKLMNVLRGNREPLVLGSDWDYKAIQIAPNESQFLEANGYSNAECARIYGPGMPEMLGYETGGSMTYANIEQRAIDLLQFTLDPWLIRCEKVLTDLLPRPQYAKLDRAALLRTDLLTRFKAHEIALRNEFETVNEVRKIEDKPAVDWGDTPTSTKSLPPVAVTVED